MKKTKKLLLILIFILTIIITLLILLILNNNKIEQKEDILEDNLIMKYTYDMILKPESVASDYCTIQYLFENYINWIGYKNDEDLINILSPSYLSEYNIDINNVFDFLNIKEIKEDFQYYKIVLTDVLTTQIDDVTYIYIIKGNCRIEGTDIMFPVQAMFKLNTSNKLYYVYPEQYMIDKGYDKLNIGDKVPLNNNEQIIDKEDNEYSNIVKSDAEMAELYFDNYKELMMYYPDIAYSKLNVEYSNKRFKDIGNFKNYLEENIALINLLQMKQYKISIQSEYTDYICLDSYGNAYTFRNKNGVMSYEVFLDSYTIVLDEFSDAYNKLNNFDKAKYNMNKIENMLNTKDYNALYSILDETFKYKNFKSVKSLEEFIEKNFYDINTIEITKFDNTISQYYVFTCKISNALLNSENKEGTIIISKTDGIDFTMSFSF